MKPISIAPDLFAGEDGKIYNQDGSEKKHYVNGDGYYTVGIKTPEGKFATVGVHRLVAFAFKPPSIDHLLLTVNHLDGDITNNVPSNVEWETNKNNIVHGCLLNRYTKRPLIVYQKGEETFYFDDLYDASVKFDMDIDTIWKNIRDDILIDGGKIEHLKSSDKRVLGFKRLHPWEGKNEKIPVKMYDLETSEIAHFEDIGEASKRLGVKRTLIRIRITTPGFIKVFKRRYVFVLATENFDFLTPEIKKELIERNKPLRVLGYHMEHQTWDEFDSVYQFINTTRTSRKAVHNRLRKGSLEPIGVWIIKYIPNIQDSKDAILKMVRSLENDSK